MADFELNKDNCYDRAYETFLKHSDLHEAIYSCLGEHLPRALKKLQIRNDELSSFNILSIGAGSGQMDLRILDMIAKEYPKNGVYETKLLNRAIEPHLSSLQEYRDLVKNEASSSLVKFEFEEKTIDEYLIDNHAKHQFDLIQSIHSFYFTNDVKSALQHCYESELRNKGLIAMIASREDGSIFHKVHKSMEKFKASSTLAYMDTKGFVEVVKECQYNYEVWPVLYTIDVTEILRDNNSIEGNLLLDFFTFEANFRQRFDKEIVNRVCELLKSSSQVDNEGRVLVKTLDELVLVYKPNN